jgi:hypothetical protein
VCFGLAVLYHFHPKKHANRTLTLQVTINSGLLSGTTGEAGEVWSPDSFL